LPLYGEVLHVPCLLSLPEVPTPIPRFGGLCQPMDLGATLADWMSGGEEAGDNEGRSLLPLFRAEPTNWRQYVIALREQENMIRTRAWMMRTASNLSAGAELFVKPDDRWECNEIGDLCPEVIQQMQALQAAVLAATASGAPFPAGELDEILVSPDR